MSIVSRRTVKAFKWRMLYVIRALFRIGGRNWNDFYAWMLDYQDRKVTLDQILSRPRNPHKFKGLWDWSRGEYYLEFMVRHGLRPDHHVLDCGCGYGRVTIPLLKFQDGGAYVGTEISQARIKLAHEWIAREDLQDKQYQLVISKENALPFIANNSIDVIWVLSVFNHMPDAELKTMLSAAARVLRPGGTLFAYYVVPEPGAPQTLKTFRRSDDQMRAMLEAVGLTSRLADDWDDDLGAARPSESRMRICRHVSTLKHKEIQPR